MKIENMKNKIKYKSQIKNLNGSYNGNPDILGKEIAPHDFIDLQESLKNQSNNSKIDSNSSSRSLFQSINLEAKITRRKKREGD